MLSSTQKSTFTDIAHQIPNFMLKLTLENLLITQTNFCVNNFRQTAHQTLNFTHQTRPLWDLKAPHTKLTWASLVCDVCIPPCGQTRLMATYGLVVCGSWIWECYFNGSGSQIRLGVSQKYGDFSLPTLFLFAKMCFHNHRIFSGYSLRFWLREALFTSVRPSKQGVPSVRRCV